jgi:hypothetical protein
VAPQASTQVGDFFSFLPVTLRETEVAGYS